MSVLPPWFFVALGVLWLAVFVLAFAMAATAARGDRELEERAGFSKCPSHGVFLGDAGRPAAAHPVPRSGRGGQLERTRQERAARDALRCSGGRVDVAHVRCPVSLDELDAADRDDLYARIGLQR